MTQSRKYLDSNCRVTCSNHVCKYPFTDYIPDNMIQHFVNECSCQCLLICLYCSRAGKSKLGGTVPWTSTVGFFVAFGVLVLCKATKNCVKIYTRRMVCASNQPGVNNIHNAFPKLCWMLGNYLCSSTDEVLYSCLVGRIIILLDS